MNSSASARPHPRETPVIKIVLEFKGIALRNDE